MQFTAHRKCTSFGLITIFPHKLWEKIVSLLNTDIVTLLASDLLLKMLTDLGKKYAKFTCRSPFLHVQLHQLIYGAGDGELESSKMMISVENV